jgi:hypothetical protein
MRRKERATDRAKLDATPPWETRVRDEPEATTGPYDERDAPTDEIARVDLGALLVPVAENMELRLEMTETQQIVAVSVIVPDGSLQLSVFAAPRNEGIWDDVRAEIIASANSSGAKLAERADGPFGAEAAGQLSVEGGLIPARFIGVDGPRWFLRGLMVGPVAAEQDKAESLEELLRNTIVVRGKEPLPVRDQVPLRLPKELQAP